MAEIGPATLAEVIRVLGPRLNTLQTPSKGPRYGKVWIGGVEDARGLAFRHVFLPGVNEGLFPRPPAEDPLLLQSQRDALGVALRPDDAELLQVAVASAERLTVSFSRLDLLTGRERVPFVLRVCDPSRRGGREIDVREFRAAARGPPLVRASDGPRRPIPSAALDDAEFDLATLAPLTAGSGQYLKSLPGRAVASLRARWARCTSRGNPPTGC